MNFTMKSGGLKYHGQVSDFIRNTVFDTWSFTQKAVITKNALGQTIPTSKPTEHQNELSATIGGKVPFTHEKMFFFVGYDRFHSRRGANPSLFTIPTTLMQGGDFTELNGSPGSGLTGTGSNNPAFLYDPTTTKCSGTCTRQPFMGMKNGLPTNNVIPASYLSPIAQKMQSFLPAPTNTATVTNNYLGGYPCGFDNYVVDYRVDYDLSSRQRISTIGAMGTVNYLNNFNTPSFRHPTPAATSPTSIPKVFDVEDAYTINAIVNQLKYGYTRFYQNIHNTTQGSRTSASAHSASPTFRQVRPARSSPVPPSAPQRSLEPCSSTGPAPLGPQVPSHADHNAEQLCNRGQSAVGQRGAFADLRRDFPVAADQQRQPVHLHWRPGFHLQRQLDSAIRRQLAHFQHTSPTGYSYASYLLGAVGGYPLSVCSRSAKWVDAISRSLPMSRTPGR